MEPIAGIWILVTLLPLWMWTEMCFITYCYLCFQWRGASTCLEVRIGRVLKRPDVTVLWRGTICLGLYSGAWKTAPVNWNFVQNLASHQNQLMDGSTTRRSVCWDLWSIFLKPLSDGRQYRRLTSQQTCCIEVVFVGIYWRTYLPSLVVQ